jgi:GTP-binding protein
LINIRHPAQAIDVEFVQWAGEHAIPLALVFTKADKQSANKNKSQVNRYMQELRKSWEEVPPYFISSSVKRQGREEILMYIQNINRELLS